jgi:hypothetical protein|uniref:DUF6152 family protein n=1 Tax=Altererythrobacter segetis TaxID=1104773 RepID=UPI0014089663|nr:DUF6152 family protein [Altererythrobacter segetis]
MRFPIACAAALALCLPALPVQAHHSMAMFDQTKTVTISGTVKQFQWTNPHCYIQLVAKDAKGAETEWSLEMGAPMYLYAKGWRPSSLKAGNQITVTLNPLRNGEPGGIVLTASTADGKQIGKSLARTS